MAQSVRAFTPDSVVDQPFAPGEAFSSSLGGPRTDDTTELPDSPGGALLRERRVITPYSGVRETRPFRSLALGLTLGSGGIGVQLATPVSRKLNLRTDASFFTYTTSFVVDTIPINGHLHLASLAASLDYAPTGGNFHISPGLTLYENTNFNADIFIAGNQVITLDGQNYTSDPRDPIRGSAYVEFGKTVAPRLTIGYGNVIRHHTAGFTFPVELGLEYIRTPTATFDLTGSSCDSTGDCGPINNDPSTQENIQEQRREINDQISAFRFFPIFSFGVSYKFGH